MDELSDLFAAVDAAQIADDVMEYGMIAGVAVASGVAWNWLAAKALSYWPSAPSWVGQYVMPGAALVLGAVGGSYVAGKYNRNVGAGIGVGLATVGLTQLAKQFFPTLPLNGLGSFAGPEDEAMLGLGNGQAAFNRYLAASGQQRGLGNSTVTVEDVGGPLGNATVSIEAMNGFGGPSFAAAFA